MNVTYRRLNYGSDLDCELLAKWANDPEIRHLSTPFSTSEAAATLMTPQDFRKRSEHPRPNRTSLLIEVNNVPVGHSFFELFPGDENPNRLEIAWLAIVIGEASARGKGLGMLVMNYVESLAKEQGARRAEIGVFEFNDRARRLYEKLGYREFARKPDFTYWNGRMWTDIRMAKVLI